MNKSRCAPVLVHPQVNRVATELSDLLNRFERYSEALSSQVGHRNTKLTLLLGLTESEFTTAKSWGFAHLDIVRITKPTSNFLYFGLKSRFILARRGIAPTMLISGDLTSGLLSSLVISKFSRAHIPLQASIHGDLNTFESSFTTRLKLNIKKKLVGLLLTQVDSVRVVSDFLKDDLIDYYNLEPSKLFVAHVPVSFYPSFSNRNSSSLRIGIVGRLHYERNLVEATRIIDSVISDERVDKIVIIGDGPMRKTLEGWIQSHVFRKKICLRGALTQQEMQLVWSDIDVLLSCAISEGYGLALREAVISGAMVVARENPGTLELKQLFPESVSLYRTPVEAIKSLLQTNLQSRLICVENTANLQRKLDERSINMVARSWISC